MATDDHPRLKILIFADRSDDADLIRQALGRGGLTFTDSHVSAAKEFIEALERFVPNVVLLCDTGSPFGVDDALAHVRHAHPEIPVVVLTSGNGEEAAVALLKAGAKDYVLKNNPARLASAVESAALVEQGVRARKAAEQKLRDSEARFRNFVEATEDVAWEIGPDDIFIYVSPRATTLLGYDPEELIGKSCHAIVSPAAAAQAAIGFEQLKAERKSFSHLEKILVRKDGREIVVESSAAPIFADDGSFKGYRGLYHDITERKRIERELQTRAAILATEHEASPDGIVVVSTDHKILSYNQRLIDLFHVPPEIMASGSETRGIAWSMPQTAAPDEVKAHIAAVQADPSASSHTEQALVDGRVLDVHSAPMPRPEGGYYGRIWFFRDITERKRIEQELQTRAAILATEHEASPDGIFVISMDHKVLSYNQRFVDLFQIPPEIMASGDEGRIISWAMPQTVDADKMTEHVAAVYADPSSTSHDERALTDGRFLDVHSAPMPRPEGGYYGRIWFFRDITERKRMELELETRIAILATEHEASPDGILIITPDRKVISYNQRFVDLFRIPPEIMATRDDDKIFAYTLPQIADAEIAAAQVVRLQANPAESLHVEGPLTDGRFVDIHALPMARPQGGYYGRAWFFRDITKLKTTEAALRTSEAHLSNALQLARAGHWLYDVASDRFTFNDNFYRIFRTTVQDVGSYVLSSEDYAKRFCHPDDIDVVGKEVLAAINATDPNYSRELEHRILYADGETGWIAVRFSIVKDKNGKTVSTYGVNQDITHRKLTEERLRRTNRSLRTLSSGNEVLVRFDNEADLYRETCRVLVEHGGYRLAWIGMPQQEGRKKHINPLAWAGPAANNMPSIDWWGTQCEGLCGHAIESGEPQVSQNLDADPRMAAWKAKAAELNLASAAVYPLKDGDEVFAVMAVYAAETDAFDADEVELLRELMADLTFGVRAARERRARIDLIRRWQTSLEATVGAIARAVEMRDPYTAGHQLRVARLAMAIGRALNLSENDARGLYLAGVIHDVGKITVPAEILNKPGKLTALEYELIKGHAQSGYDIVKDIDFPWPIAQMLLQHHERLDGSGYPHGLRSEAILPQTKILAVADVVDAMMSHRPYRPALGLDAALAEIIAKRGRLYDPAAVDACVALFREKKFSFDAPQTSLVA